MKEQQNDKRPHGGYLNQFRNSHFGTQPATVNDLRDLAVALMYELKPLLEVHLSAVKETTAEKVRDNLKITYSNHGETYTAELPWDADLTRVILAMMNLLVAASFSKEQIEEIFKEGGSPWEWQ